MRTALAHAAQRRAERRQRSGSLSTVPPAEHSDDYVPEVAKVAASILYRSPLPSKSGRPLYILNAAAFPDAFEIDYDTLLPYVLARLPGEDELLSGTEYEIVFFAGGQPEGATTEKKQGPGIGWYLQAYHVLSRAMRKKLQKLFIVHPRTWVRVLVGVFGTIVSPKFRRKIVHVNTLSALAARPRVRFEDLLVPPSAYLQDRKLSPDIYVANVSGRRAFGVRHPLPKNMVTAKTRLPRVLRETTSFLLDPANIKTEGLFRIPPHSTLASILKEAYDRGQKFIVWKEKEVTFVQPGVDPSLLGEIRLEDAYGVHLAASLIKQWYRDLREPIFPESSYGALNEKYSNPETKVTPEDLVDMLLPQSESSPLPAMSRQILTSHLLPLLSEVAHHEPENKMNAENLGILFSMCCLCGSNQLEDAKVSAIVKRVLQAAIDMWPQLRDGMGISVDDFAKALQPPPDFRDYEDPLEEEKPPPNNLPQEEDAVEEEEEEEDHRIVLEDSEEVSAPERAPTLPPRSVNASGRSNAPSLPPRYDGAAGVQRAPTLPPRPQVPGVSPTTPTFDSNTSGIPRRKPAPPAVDLPRYSSVFDADGNSLYVADSPSSYAPADGFGPARHGPWSFDEPEKKGFPPSEFPVPTDPHPALNIPKRKAVSNEYKTEPAPTAEVMANPESRSASDGATLARMAAQKAALNLAQQAVAAFRTTKSPEVVESPESVLSEGDGVFRKPTWPASARPQSLAKPFVPVQHSQTFPVMSPAANGVTLAPSNVPKRRGPSPGLMKRMTAMEVGSDTTSQSKVSLEPHKLNLKKSSVDDLRRLYEERVNTAHSLAKADAARKGSMSAS